MFLTEEENRTLTQVGPGTPGGELLRRYWLPVAGLHEVTDQSPTAHVRILGENLVLFRVPSGEFRVPSTAADSAAPSTRSSELGTRNQTVGLLADHCSHRGASLLYGRVEERGIACAYHGWLYDVEGNCLETPAEPAESKLHLTVKHRAYPVEKLMGLYWAYLGPPPAPPIRRLDVASYPVERILEMAYDVNWVQVVENHVDSTHIYILHQDTTGRSESGTARSGTRGWIDRLASLDYEELQFGVRRKIVPEDSQIDDDLVVFPNMLRRINQVQIHVPIDDTHTRTFKLYFQCERDGSDDANQEPVDYSILQPGEAKFGTGTYPDAQYRMDRLTGQDVMAIETQGPVSPRASWRLATSDRGVVLFERMLLREMDRVQDGHDPLGVIRDPNQVIDTNFELYRRLSAGTAQQFSREGLRVYARPRASDEGRPPSALRKGEQIA